MAVGWLIFGKTRQGLLPSGGQQVPGDDGDDRNDNQYQVSRVKQVGSPLVGGIRYGVIYVILHGGHRFVSLRLGGDDIQTLFHDSGNL